MRPALGALLILVAGMASFVVCLLTIFALRPAATALKLIDKPGGRKMHQGEVPVTGGLGILIGIICGTALLPLPSLLIALFLAASSILVTIGLIDDRFDLSPWARLAVQATVAVLFTLLSGFKVSELGSILGADPLTLSRSASYALTVLAMMAAMNAFNMLDGIDRLAATIALVTLVPMVALSHDGIGTTASLLALVAIGAIAAFLVANVPGTLSQGMRCFLGDSGSTLLGFTVVVVGILLSQGDDRATAPVTVLWLAALPIYDILWAIVRRLLRGGSPLRPDDEHLHHLLLRAGLPVRHTFAVLVSLAAALAGFGISLERLGVPEPYSFALFAISGLLVVRLLYAANLFVAADFSAAAPAPVDSFDVRPEK